MDNIPQRKAKGRKLILSVFINKKNPCRKFSCYADEEEYVTGIFKLTKLKFRPKSREMKLLPYANKGNESKKEKNEVYLLAKDNI